MSSHVGPGQNLFDFFKNNALVKIATVVPFEISLKESQLLLHAIRSK